MQRSLGHPRINIVQGEWHVSGDPQLSITTLLGSCVAACISDSAAGVGGMNHFLLPGDAAHPGSPRAQFMYENADGDRLTLYVAVFKPGSAPAATEFRLLPQDRPASLEDVRRFALHTSESLKAQLQDPSEPLLPMATHRQGFRQKREVVSLLRRAGFGAIAPQELSEELKAMVNRKKLALVAAGQSRRRIPSSEAIQDWLDQETASWSSLATHSFAQERPQSIRPMTAHGTSIRTVLLSIG